MSFGNFLPQEQDLLIGIIFRVGYWISHVDDTDVEDQSEQKEQTQMIVALKKIADSRATTDLVREVAAEALRRTGDQARWLRNEDHLLHDVAKAVHLINSQGTEDDYAAFRKALMFIATSVARAYREESDIARHDTALSKLLDKAGTLFMAVSDRDTHQDMNISPAEDTALHELASALAR